MPYSYYKVREMNKLQAKKTLITLVHPFVIWVLCGATMGIGPAITTLENALIIHAVAAPIFAAIISSFYYRNFGYTLPFATAVIFVLFILFLDFFVVAYIVLDNFDMFRSAIGIWIPFTLMFLSIFLVGFLRGAK